MSAKAGHKMFLYRNTATHASPTWSLISEIGDVNIPDLAYGAAEFKRRAKTFTKNLPTLIQTFGVEFKLFHGVGKTVFDAIRADFFAGTVREYAVMDGAIAVVGSEGITLPAFIQDFPWNQALEEVSDHDVKLVVGYLEESTVEIDPEWLVVEE